MWGAAKMEGKIRTAEARGDAAKLAKYAEELDATKMKHASEMQEMRHRQAVELMKLKHAGELE